MNNIIFWTIRVGRQLINYTSMKDNLLRLDMEKLYIIEKKRQQSSFTYI